MVTPPEVVPDFGSRFCGGSGISPLKLARISATFRRSVWLVGLAVAECSLLLAGLSVGVTGVTLCKKNAKIIRFCARNLRTKRPHIALLNLNLNFPPVFWVCLQTKYQLSTWSKKPTKFEMKPKDLAVFFTKNQIGKNFEKNLHCGLYVARRPGQVCSSQLCYFVPGVCVLEVKSPDTLLLFLQRLDLDRRQ